MRWQLKLRPDKDVFLGRFPRDFNVNTLVSPVGVHKIISPKLQNKARSTKDDSEEHVWVVKDSSTDTWKIKNCYLGNKEDAADESYFLFVEKNDGIIDVIPVEYHFQFNLNLLSDNAAESFEKVEKQAVLKAIKEANVAARVQNLLKHDSDDENIPKRKQASSAASVDAEPSIEDDFGIKRQEAKRRKFVKRYKQGNLEKQDDYVNSALSLSALRHHQSSWDFEEGVPSDDEEDNALSGHAAFDDAEDDQNKTFEDSGAPDDNLTSYGQTVVSLLKQQEKQEVEDELDQYSDDEEEDAETGEAGDSSGPPNSWASSSSNVDVKPQAGYPVQKLMSSSTSSTVGGITAPKQPSLKEEVRARIIRILTQNMGRMNIKDLMAVFKFKERNEEFFIVQEAIQQLCSKQAVDVNGKKANFIVLKPEFRR